MCEKFLFVLHQIALGPYDEGELEVLIARAENQQAQSVGRRAKYARRGKTRPVRRAMVGEKQVTPGATLAKTRKHKVIALARTKIAQCKVAEDSKEHFDEEDSRLHDNAVAKLAVWCDELACHDAFKDKADRLAELITRQDWDKAKDVADEIDQIAAREARASTKQSWLDRLTINWRPKGARDLFKYLRGKEGANVRTFCDAKGVRTADPEKIDGIFRNFWSTIFNRAKGTSRPSFTNFKKKFGRYFNKVELPEEHKGPPVAAEMASHVSRMNPMGTCGADGWLPSELRLLPLAAWEAREEVEMVIWKTVKYPSAYYDIPVSMLRKGAGRTPEQHRGISVYSALYRLTSGVWWNRLVKAGGNWIHPDAYGGVPDRECITAAIKAQFDLEFASLFGHELAYASADYYKFFDTFCAVFFEQLNVDIGIPPKPPPSLKT